MTTEELVAGLREYVEAVAGADEIAGVPVEELADNHMQMRGRYIDANAWMESNALTIADELERLRAEAGRLRRILSQAFCTINKLTTHSIRDSKLVEDDAIGTLTSIAFELEGEPALDAEGGG